MRDEQPIGDEQALAWLGAALAARDPRVFAHGRRVEALTSALSDALGLDAGERHVASWAARLHDLGKLAVPAEMLDRPGPLDPFEWALVRRHPDLGAALVLAGAGTAPVAEVVRSHHERWDGAGYPQGLRGEDIPPAARLLAVADVFDALTSDRAYRGRAQSPAEAAETLAAGAGTHFEPSTVEAFLDAGLGARPAHVLAPTA